jgi:hypothetical protein
MMKKGARKGAGSGSSMARGSQSRDTDMTRQLNEQELSRLRGG